MTHSTKYVHSALAKDNPWKKWLPSARGKPCLPEDVVEYWQDQWKTSIKEVLEMPLRDFDDMWSLHTTSEKVAGQATLSAWRQNIRALLDAGAPDEGIKDAILCATVFMNIHKYGGQPLTNTLFYEALDGRCGKAWAAWALAAVAVIASHVVSKINPYTDDAKHPACDVWVHGGFKTLCKTADRHMVEKANRLSQNMPSSWWFTMARARSRHAEENVSFRGLTFIHAGELSAIHNMGRFAEFLSDPAQRNLRDENGKACDDMLPEIFKKKSARLSVARNDVSWASKLALALARYNPSGSEEGEKCHEEKEPSALPSLAWLMTKKWEGSTAPGVNPGADVVPKILNIAYPRTGGNHAWADVWFDGCENAKQREDRLMDLCMAAIWSMGRPDAAGWADFIRLSGAVEDGEGEDDREWSNGEDEKDEKQENEIRSWWNVLWRLSDEVTYPAWENALKEIENASEEVSSQDIKNTRNIMTNALRDKAFVMVFAHAWAREKARASNDEESVSPSPSIERWRDFFRERAREGWRQSPQMWEMWDDLYPGIFVDLGINTYQKEKTRKMTFSQTVREFRAFFEKDALQHAHRQTIEKASLATGKGQSSEATATKIERKPRAL